MVSSNPDITLSDLTVNILRNYCKEHKLQTVADVLDAVYDNEFPNVESIKRYYRNLKK